MGLLVLSPSPLRSANLAPRRLATKRLRRVMTTVRSAVFFAPQALAMRRFYSSLPCLR
jgi:hypothetical protein